MNRFFDSSVLLQTANEMNTQTENSVVRPIIIIYAWRLSPLYERPTTCQTLLFEWYTKKANEKKIIANRAWGIILRQEFAIDTMKIQFNY